MNSAKTAFHIIGTWISEATSLWKTVCKRDCHHKSMLSSLIMCPPVKTLKMKSLISAKSLDSGRHKQLGVTNRSWRTNTNGTQGKAWGLMFMDPIKQNPSSLWGLQVCCPTASGIRPAGHGDIFIQQFSFSSSALYLESQNKIQKNYTYKVISRTL